MNWKETWDRIAQKWRRMRQSPLNGERQGAPLTSRPSECHHGGDLRVTPHLSGAGWHEPYFRQDEGVVGANPENPLGLREDLPGTQRVDHRKKKVSWPKTGGREMNPLRNPG